MLRPMIPLLLLALSAPPSLASELLGTVTADGACERLVIEDVDLTAQCGTPVMQMHESNGRVAASAGTGGQAWFGLAEPERMVLFYGPGNGDNWTDHAVNRIVVHDNATGANVIMRDAAGTCTYRDADPGRLVTCEAEDAAGKTYALTYRTDGGPGFTF
ncbi:hypothetical protein SAMN06295905_0733 [Devosia lucknowensis]|uniref:Uncharacterized protein n=1 Tax=Devosia lucknowensis TaxID=1096929 RepID=A0A1Y6EJS5_9HYPH|nr:hypothetical protein [Devosia lucknowensis]SMQ62888.1 hypothetical protein SAMN06295905_0733 [Devosia lucknowensis]